MANRCDAREFGQGLRSEGAGEHSNRYSGRESICSKSIFKLRRNSGLWLRRSEDVGKTKKIDSSELRDSSSE